MLRDFREITGKSNIHLKVLVKEVESIKKSCIHVRLVTL